MGDIIKSSNGNITGARFLKTTYYYESRRELAEDSGEEVRQDIESTI